MDDDAITSTLDYLGRQQPIGQRALSALPGESGGGPVTAPVTPGTPGFGNVTALGGAPGLATGATGAGPNAASSPAGPPGVPALARALSGLLGVNKGLQFARALMGGNDLGSAIGAAGGLGQVGEDTIASLVGQGIPQSDLDALLAQFPGGAQVASDFAGLGAGGASAGAEAGGELAQFATTGMEALSAAAPIWSGLTAAVDFLGEGKIPFQNVIEAIFPGTFGPSQAWQSFRGRLGHTLQGEYGASTTLAEALTNARPEEVPGLIAAWRQSVGEVIPGFGSSETDPYALTALPGAGGSRGGAEQGTHEGFNVDFAPFQAGLAAEIDAARQGLPTADRISAFHTGMQPLLDAAAATKAQRQAEYDEWMRTYDPGTGSA